MRRTITLRHRFVVLATALVLGVIAVVTSSPSEAAGTTAFGAVVKPKRGRASRRRCAGRRRTTGTSG